MPARRDISIYKGDDYSHRLEVLRDGAAVDLSGKMFAAQVRDGEDGPVLVEFSVNTSESDDGIVFFDLTNEQTSQLNVGVYSYDIQQDDNGVIQTLTTGRVYVSREITR
jgi:hypothetical protein